MPRISSTADLGNPGRSERRESAQACASDFLLFCKSYSGDIKRVQRLWTSVRYFLSRYR